MREAGKVCFRGLLVEVCLALVGVASPAQFKYTKFHSPKQSVGPGSCYENYTATLPGRLVVRYQMVIWAYFEVAIPAKPRSSRRLETLDEEQRDEGKNSRGGFRTSREDSILSVRIPAVTYVRH